MKLITAPVESSMCLFLVGMQVRGFSSLWKVPQVTGQMFKMQKLLAADKDSGFLWGENFTKRGPFTTLFLSYWKSADHIHKFVANPNMPHVSAAKNYWKKLSSDQNLGVWHETYEVTPGSTENLYMGMTAFGASGFLKTIPVERQSGGYMNRLRGR